MLSKTLFCSVILDKQLEFLLDESLLVASADVLTVLTDVQITPLLLSVVPELQPAETVIFSVTVCEVLDKTVSDGQSLSPVRSVFVSTTATLSNGSWPEVQSDLDVTFSVPIRFRLVPKHFRHSFGNAVHLISLLHSGIFSSGEATVCKSDKHAKQLQTGKDHQYIKLLHSHEQY